jgi:hypothetical protein
MKRLLVALPFLLLAGAASADMANSSAGMPRYDISGMSCAEIRAALASDGSAILRWPSSKVDGMMRYQRYISPNGSCKMQMIKAMTTIKASDGSCRVATCNQYGKAPQRN